MKNFFFLFLILFSNFGFSADLPDRFRQAALSMISEAEASGLTEVDGVSIQEMKHAAQNIPILYDPRITVVFGNRRCAMWDRFSSKVNVHIRLNKSCADLSDNEAKILATHEILGAQLGRDLNYEITMRMLTKQITLDSAKQVQWRKNRERATLKLSESGGSTGVGGGGDIVDIRFKIAGLQKLKELAGSNSTLFGIPVDVLQEALFQMKIAPAQNIPTLMEFRSRGVETSLDAKAILYVSSDFYRQADPRAGLWALYAARVFVIYAPYDIGLIENEEDQWIYTSQQIARQGEEFRKRNQDAIDADSFESTHIFKRFKLY